MGVRLPGEYQEVEWIESTGTQWINTRIPIDVFVNPNVTWILRFSLTNATRTQILGGANSNKKQIVVISNRLRADWANASDPYFSAILSTNTVYTISQRNGIYEFIDGSGNIESFTITKWNGGSYPFVLFAKSTNEEGTAVETSTRAYMRLYSFTIFGDTEIANFIPCYRKSDSEIGMYDTVSKTFYTNAGTGAFLKGSDVSYEAIDLLGLRRMVMMGYHKERGLLWELPTPMDMQYINTGILVTEDMSFTVLSDFENIDYSSSDREHRFFQVSNEAYVRIHSVTRQINAVFGGVEVGTALSPTGRIRMAFIHRVGENYCKLLIYHENNIYTYTTPTAKQSWFNGIITMSLGDPLRTVKGFVNDCAFYNLVKSDAEIEKFLTMGKR